MARQAEQAGEADPSGRRLRRSRLGRPPGHSFGASHTPPSQQSAAPLSIKVTDEVIAARMEL